MKNITKNIKSFCISSVKAVKRLNTRKKVLLVCVAAILVAATATTVALLASVTNPIKNLFALPEIKTEIVEKFEENVKESVQVKNTGDSDVFVRAAVVVNWKDESGNVYAKAPVAGTDYTIDFNTTNWTKKGNYYYYNTALAPSKTTENLLKTAVTDKGVNTPTDYHLSVEILEEAIQAKPEKAVKEAWGLTASENSLTF